MGPFKNRQQHCKSSDKGHGHFLKSTCDIGDIGGGGRRDGGRLIVSTRQAAPMIYMPYEVDSMTNTGFS